MLKENRRRLTWQLGLAIVFFSFANFVMIEQYPREYQAELNNHAPLPHNNPYYDPWQDDPWNFNPFDAKMHIIESYSVLLCFLYGCLRLFNIMRIIVEDNNASPWEHFWEMCEDLNNGE